MKIDNGKISDKFFGYD